jgi:hypothetical protein
MISSKSFYKFDKYIRFLGGANNVGHHPETLSMKLFTVLVY